MCHVSRKDLYQRAEIGKPDRVQRNDKMWPTSQNKCETSFLRAIAECFARLSHRLNVCLSVCLSVRHTLTLYQNGDI